MGRKATNFESMKIKYIKAAEELFREKGYDDISISEIARKMDMSHGAFFYYFKSKEEVMQAVIMVSLKESEKYLKALASDGSMSAKEKMQLILTITVGALKEEQPFIDFVRSPANTGLYREYLMRSREITIPPVTDIVKQGISEGSFRVEYPEETVRYLIYVFENLTDAIYPLKNDQECHRRLRALEIVVSKFLGVDEGEFTLTEQVS